MIYTYVIRSGVQMCVQWDSVSSYSPGDRSSVFTRSKIVEREQMFEHMDKKISAFAPIVDYYTGSLSQAALTPNSKLSLYEMAVHTFVTFNGSNAYSLCKTLN